MTLSERVKALYDESQCGSWYLDMQPWQREELSREELYQYAEELYQVIHNINDFLMEWLLYKCDFDVLDEIQDFIKRSKSFEISIENDWDEGYKDGYEAAMEQIDNILKVARG